MDLTYSLKPVLPADVEQRLNEPPPRAVREFLVEPYVLDQEQIEHYREHGFVKLEQVIPGEALRYFREVIGYAVGHYFVEDDRAPGGQAGCTSAASCRRSTWGGSTRRSAHSPTPSGLPTWRGG